jgi:hypothetical protein
VQKSPRAKVLIKTTTTRDVLLAIAIGMLLLGFLAWAIVSLSSGVAGKMLTGTIVAKHFTPQPEHQITIGKGGLRERDLAGEYTFEVYIESEKKTYTIWVDKRDYDARKTGEPFQFLRPPDE